MIYKKKHKYILPSQMSTQSNQKTRETVAKHLKSSEYRLELSFCIIVFFGTNTQLWLLGASNWVSMYSRTLVEYTYVILCSIGVLGHTTHVSSVGKCTLVWREGVQSNSIALWPFLKTFGNPCSQTFYNKSQF